jgi:hypothetical protein
MLGPKYFPQQAIAAKLEPMRILAVKDPKSVLGFWAKTAELNT